jgi:hypothetical protein
MTKHTQGPWTLYNPTVNTLAVHTEAGSIAEWPQNYTPQDLADARLIAASPELLEACKLAVMMLSVEARAHEENQQEGKAKAVWGAVKRILAIIEKAEGTDA